MKRRRQTYSRMVGRREGKQVLLNSIWRKLERRELPLVGSCRERARDRRRRGVEVPVE